jgi:hypothetical protein
MPIELVRVRDRKQIAWLREAPPADAKRIFEERDYYVDSKPCTDAQLQDHVFLSGLSAVVITQSAAKPLQIAKALEAHARRLLDYDCRIVLYSIPANGASILSNKLNELRIPTAGLPEKEAAIFGKWQNPMGDPPLPYARYFDSSVPWHKIANFVSDNPPGAAPDTTLRITVDPIVDRQGNRLMIGLTDQATLLLQRAFADCIDLHLTPLDGGRSGVSVYKACAELKGGLHGQWPQPHFVKIGSRDKIFAEYEIYEGHVDPYVPFHLGPHLVNERCCLGATEGIIVGDYVEESESLRYCAYDGRSASAIACLFDRTLLGWHRRASKVDTPLSDGLQKHFPRRINTERLKRAGELGAMKTLEELRELFLRCKTTPVLAGPIHGDLHAANVRVRATDAVVIDFFAHKKDYPLLWDAAALEASLLVEGFGDADKNWNVDEIKKWIESLEPLYDGSPLEVALTHANPKSRSLWFHACVQQIRRYARQWECRRDQYAAVLALALLLKATKDADVSEPQASRRAAAYLLAERLLVNNFAGKSAKPSAPAPSAVATERGTNEKKSQSDKLASA